MGHYFGWLGASGALFWVDGGGWVTILDGGGGGGVGGVGVEGGEWE